MKTKKFNKRLDLNKTTVTNLDANDMKRVFGASHIGAICIDDSNECGGGGGTAGCTFIFVEYCCTDPDSYCY